MVPGLLFKNKIMNFQANNELLLNMNVKSIRSNMEINMLLKYILNYSFCLNILVKNNKAKKMKKNCFQQFSKSLAYLHKGVMSKKLILHISTNVIHFLAKSINFFFHFFFFKIFLSLKPNCIRGEGVKKKSILHISTNFMHCLAKKKK